MIYRIILKPITPIIAPKMPIYEILSKKHVFEKRKEALKEMFKGDKRLERIIEEYEDMVSHLDNMFEIDNEGNAIICKKHLQRSFVNYLRSIRGYSHTEAKKMFEKFNLGIYDESMKYFIETNFIVIKPFPFIRPIPILPYGEEEHKLQITEILLPSIHVAEGYIKIDAQQEEEKIIMEALRHGGMHYGLYSRTRYGYGKFKIDLKEVV